MQTIEILLVLMLCAAACFGHSVWNLIVFLLNSLIFVIIGLQLRTVIENLSEYTWPNLLGLAAALSAAAIVIRMLWVFPGAYLPHLLSSRVRARWCSPTRRIIATACALHCCKPSGAN